MSQTLTSTSPDIAARQQCEVSSTSGAIGIKSGVELITLAGIAALTLAAPVAGQDDGKELKVISTTANAHTITTPASGINGAYHVFTFAGYIGNSVSFTAYNGIWWVGTTSSGTASAAGTLS